ncbi:MAG: BMP family ABC transporter substrate-binding protein [Actinomycetota bacterium]|nr:BMP family ABC transporter substrate-binding protein [Actinomycetota bacterium]
MTEGSFEVAPPTESRRSFLRKAGLVTVAGVAAPALFPELLAACSSSTKSTATTKSKPSSSAPSSIAFVSPQSSGGDPPVLDMIAAMDAAGKKYGAKTRYVFVSDPSSYTSTLDLLAASYDVVATCFPEMGTPLQAAAKAHPKTRFIWIYGTPFTPAIPNVVTVGYKFYEGMYFAGILAAHITTTNKIGYIGGAANPAINEDYWALAAGAKSVNPAISVSGAFVGSYTDPNGGQQVADSMYGSGVDVIQTDASATDLGVLKSAEAHKLYMSYDSDPTAYKQAPSLILGSAILQFGTSLALQLASAMQPTWSLAGQAIEQGMKDKVTGYTPSPVFATSAPAAVGARFTAGLKKMQAAEAAYSAGTLKIPVNTSAIP